MFKNEVMLLRNELIDIYKDLHQNPEIGFAEYRTSKIIADYLRECGLEVIDNLAITGVVGILDSGKPGKTIMLRADMDCLEILELADIDYKSKNTGYMHACGHDAHVTMLLGAAKILSQNKNAFEGKIKFIFQPAEEGIPASMIEKVRNYGYKHQGGARYMVDEGVLDDVDACIIMHVQPSLQTGKVSISKKNACASSDNFNITIVGKGGHGAQPQNAIDPVPTMAELISAIHMLPTREVSALETVVISLGNVNTPGSVWNAVAEKAIINGGLRTFNEEIRKYLNRRIQEVSNSIAEANRCTIEFDHVAGYMPCVNDESLVALVAKSCIEILGDNQVILTDEPAMTSEDASEYLSRIPGVFFWFGVGEDAQAAPLHNPYFRLDTEALEIGTQLHVNNVINLLNELNA